MKTKISVVFIIASLFLMMVPSLIAQTSLNDWSAIQKLPAKTDLFIKTFNGKTFVGSLVSVKDEEITLITQGRNFVLAKDNLKAICFAVPKTGRRARNIGALIGAVIGIAAYGAAVGDKGDSGTGAPIIPFFAGGLGGGFIGSLLGKGRKKGALIYEAK